VVPDRRHHAADVEPIGNAKAAGSADRPINKCDLPDANPQLSASA